MEHLKEIISIVDKNKTKHIDIIGRDKNKDTKLNQLYEGILAGKYNSDVQACKDLFGTNQFEKGYRNLKSRLEKRVINTLFFLDLNAVSFLETEKAYYNCYKNLAAIKILTGRGARKSSNLLAEKTLKVAMKFEFHDVSIPILKDLRQYYGTLVGNQKKYRKYNHLLQQFREESNYEEQAREMYTTLASYYANSKTIKPIHLTLAKEYAEKLEGYLDKTNYRNFHLYAHLVITLRYEIENDFHKAIENCNRALDYLKKFQHTTKTQFFVFHFKRMTSLTKLKKLEEAHVDAEKCLELVKEGNLNWFLTSQFYILLLLHSEKFQEAFGFYKKVNKIRKSKKVRSDVGKEFFNIIGAYIDYFIRIGKIEIPPNKRKPRFDSKSFMKSSPEFSKDKRGMNVTILVLQVLFFLNENKHNQVIDRMDALRTYSSRYLRQDETFRSNCFIKMLSKIPEANFNRIALERRSKDLYKKLISKPLEVANQPIEMEIIPFEKLWEMVLNSLDKKTTKNRRY